jgi:hypothetical protein
MGPVPSLRVPVPVGDERLYVRRPAVREIAAADSDLFSRGAPLSPDGRAWWDGAAWRLRLPEPSPQG